jgi:hypothetical protein
MSKRHDLVSKILQTSFVFATLFGATSVFYAVAEARLGESLEKDSALSALRITLAIDKISLNQEIIKSEVECSSRNIKDCHSYVKSLVKAKNRIKDYKILLTKTLGYSPQSDEVSTLEQQRKAIDALTHYQFGLSLSQARDQNIISIGQFIDHISQSQKTMKLMQPPKNNNKLSTIFSRSIEYLSEDIANVERIKEDTYSSYRTLRRAFLMLLIAEVTVFTLVNIADFLNNNADPEEIDKISIHQLQAKTKPLLASIFLAFICLLIGQLLLYRESERSLIENCREINRQNISLVGSLDAYPHIKNKSTIIPLLKPRQKCVDYVENLIGTDINKLESYTPDTEQLKLEIAKMKLRKYADGYQEKGSEFDQRTSNLLLSILIANVASLVALSIFLRQDSKEIG